MKVLLSASTILGVCLLLGACAALERLQFSIEEAWAIFYGEVSSKSTPPTKIEEPPVETEQLQLPGVY